MFQARQVAIADDRRLFREGLTSILRAAGYTVVEVEECTARQGTLLLGVVGFPPSTAMRVIRLCDVKTSAELVELLTLNRGQGQATHAGNSYQINTRLTDRETEVLTAVSAGESARDIGSSMGISTRTVEGHMQAVLGKLGVRSQAEAVARSMTLGLLAANS